MKTTGYAIVQYGYTIFGVGATQDEAWADASNSLDEPLTDDTTDEPRVDGAIYCLPATQALIDAVLERGRSVPFLVEWPDVGLAEESTVREA